MLPTLILYYNNKNKDDNIKYQQLGERIVKVPLHKHKLDGIHVFLSKDYFIPTEECLVWLEGWTEFPATVVDTRVFDVGGADATMGFEIGGR